MHDHPKIWLARLSMVTSVLFTFFNASELSRSVGMAMRADHPLLLTLKVFHEVERVLLAFGGPKSRPSFPSIRPRR